MSQMSNKGTQVLVLLSDYAPRLDHNKSFWPGERNILTSQLRCGEAWCGIEDASRKQHECEKDSDILRKQRERMDTGKQ